MSALNSSAYFDLDNMVSCIEKYINTEDYTSAEMLCHTCLMAREYLSNSAFTSLFNLASEINVPKKDGSGHLYKLEFIKRNAQVSQVYSS